MKARRVFKYAVELSDNPAIEMPVGAEILAFQAQGQTPTVWALADPEPSKVTEMRRFRCAGTGHPIHDDLGRFIGTAQMPTGLVWHLWELC